ncbi:MAG: hypothetical protein KGI75_16110, partial [Rhizobiaceae bacterium]|nr:hypothetical protein [Rhizobiaceae bacterium]
MFQQLPTRQLWKNGFGRCLRISERLNGADLAEETPAKCKRFTSLVSLGLHRKGEKIGEESVDY